MKLSYFLLGICLLIFSCKEKVIEIAKIEKGVSLELAEYRKQQVTDVTYNLSFKIPSDKEKAIVSELILETTIIDLKAPLFLDFKEDSSKINFIEANGKQIQIIHKNEHIQILQEHLVLGKNILKINFLAGELSLNRNNEFLYTLLVPDRARTLFPCFDQPNIKASYILDISAPKDWKVLCGASEIKTIANRDIVKHIFAPTDKMSTYLFSFVAGKFNTEVKTLEGFDMTLLYRENNEEKIKTSLASIFNLHKQSVSFLEEYTNYLFPFQKLDFATIPGFQYGGMEHVGAIQYRESSLFLDESATENRKLGRAKLIAHETAHMWFGDLVTMDWFNDVWMKEVFANFMADKIVNPAFPDINHDLAFMVAHYPRAYGEDRTPGTNPIRQNLDNLNNAGSLYGSIIYNKAPIMMRQLETVMGKQAFKDGIQEYIKSFENDNAVWNDLVEILDQKTTVDIKKWSEVWVNNASRPIFDDLINYDVNGKITNFEISQTAENRSHKIWPQTFDISLIYNDRIKNITVNIDAEKIQIQEAIGLPQPKAIIYNSNALGYGVFPMNKKDLNFISSLKNDVARGYAYINAYENTLNGNIKATEVLDLFQKILRTEKNELLLNLLSNYTTSIFWKFLDKETRSKYQPELANQIWSQLQKNAKPGIKKTLFSIFQSLAYSEKSREQLYKIWNKEIQINNLKLNQDNYTSMASRLAVYKHPKQDAILKTALEQIKNPDKKERFKFLLPSISNDITIRNSFFESLKEEKNRAKESWVLVALTNLNHPLRENEALKNLKPSLDLLEEIQKTGDIFFPKRWLNSTIGNHTSLEAYATLQLFLLENTALNPSLKQKLLQASDNLRRFQDMKKD